MATEAKTVIATRASQGIGAGIVRAFRDRGYRVVANPRDIITSRTFCDQLSVDMYLTLVGGDIGDPQTATKIAETAVGRFGRSTR